MGIVKILLNDLENGFKNSLHIEWSESGALHIRYALFSCVGCGDTSGNLPLMGDVDLIADEDARYLANTFTIGNHKGVEKLFINSFDDLKGAVIANGKHENVAVDTSSVTHAKL